MTQGQSLTGELTSLTRPPQGSLSVAASGRKQRGSLRPLGALADLEELTAPGHPRAWHMDRFHCTLFVLEEIGHSK